MCVSMRADVPPWLRGTRPAVAHVAHADTTGANPPSVPAGAGRRKPDPLSAVRPPRGQPSDVHGDGQGPPQGDPTCMRC